jgi:hypothetical protein
MGTWSYYPTKLATSPKDQVRLMIGDVVSSDQQMFDEEINYLITTRSNVWGAAAECCKVLAAKFSRSVDQAVGQAKVTFSQMSKAYIARATNFNMRAAAMGAGLPYAGGISVTDMLNQMSNTDRVDPQFQIGMTDDFLPVAPGGNESSIASADSTGDQTGG